MYPAHGHIYVFGTSFLKKRKKTMYLFPQGSLVKLFMVFSCWCVSWGPTYFNISTLSGHILIYTLFKLPVHGYIHVILAFQKKTTITSPRDPRHPCLRLYLQQNDGRRDIVMEWTDGDSDNNKKNVT